MAGRLLENAVASEKRDFAGVSGNFSSMRSSRHTTISVSLSIDCVKLIENSGSFACINQGGFAMGQLPIRPIAVEWI
jgi:hypothetical protein